MLKKEGSNTIWCMGNCMKLDILQRGIWGDKSFDYVFVWSHDTGVIPYRQKQKGSQKEKKKEKKRARAFATEKNLWLLRLQAAALHSWVRSFRSIFLEKKGAALAKNSFLRGIPNTPRTYLPTLKEK